MSDLDDGYPFQDLYVAVGRAISCWVRVEYELRGLLQALTAPSHVRAFESAVLRIRSAAILCEMVSEALNALSVDIGTLNEWNDLSKKIGKASRTRADLAHAEAIETTFLSHTEPKFVVQEIRRPDSPRRTGKKAPPGTKQLHDIRAAATTFLALARSLHQFRRTVEAAIART